MTDGELASIVYSRAKNFTKENIDIDDDAKKLAYAIVFFNDKYFRLLKTREENLC